MKMMTMMFKNIFLALTIVSSLAIIQSCVPVEKRTECQSNEAFNPNLRVCVPTIGTNSSLLYIQTRLPQNNITTDVASTTIHQFQIVVNDVYSSGFFVTWQLRTPSNGVTILNSGSGSNPNATKVNFQAAVNANEGAGTYQLEVTVSNSTNTQVITSTAWTISVIAGATPEISSMSPNSSAISFTVNQPTTTFSITKDDNGATGVSTRWYINGIVQTASNSSLSMPLSVSQLNFGPNYIMVSVTNSAGTLTYDSAIWTVIKSYPELSFIMNGGDSVNPQTSGVSPDPNILSSGASPTQVIAVDGVSIAELPTSGFLLGSDSSDITGGLGRGFCVYVGNYNGTRNLSGISNVFVRFKLDGALLGGNIQFSGNGTVNKKCLTDATGYNTFTLTLPPLLESVGTTKTITAEICDMGPSGTKLDCGNGYLAYTYSWSVFVRSKNTTPVIASDVGAGSPPSTNTTDNDPNNDKVDIVQDLAKSFSISINDIESSMANNADYQVRWFINGVLMDGNNLFPNSTVATPDCYHTYDQVEFAGNTLGKYECDITIPSFLTSGPNNTSTYTVTAVVSDTSKYAGGINKDSNMLTWILNVTETQTAPVIQKIYGSTGASANQSFASCFALQTSPNTCISTAETTGSPDLEENKDYILKIRISDTERDNYWRRIELCKTYTVGQPISTAGSCTILSGDQYIQNPVYVSTVDGDVTTSEYVFRMPETAVIGAANGQVHFRVTIQDVPTSVPSTVVETKIFSVEVKNNNPLPTIDTVTANPAFAPVAPLTSYDVFAGMPFTFYPGVVTDASKADGKNPTYQWQICATGACTPTSVDWKDIIGATKDKLVWTPPTNLENTSVQIRACIGDDGIGNLVANCPVKAGPWTSIIIKRNHIENIGRNSNGNNFQSSGEMANWYDISQENSTVYTAYSSGTYPTASILVEKSVFMGDGSGHIDDIRSVQFLTEVSGNSGPASDLSVTGDSTTNSVFVAYKVTDEMTIPQNLTTIRIRRIFTQNALFGFNYNGITIGYNIVSAQTPFQITPQEANDKTAEIDIVESNWDPSDSISINGYQVFTGADIAGSLTTSQIAEQIATAINNIADQRVLYKVYATRSGSTVVLTGLPTNDYIDIQLYAKKLGSIMYDSVNKKVHLPFIDGLNGDKVSVVSLSTEFHLGDNDNNPISYLQLDATSGSQDLVSAYSEKSGYYYLGMKNYNGYFALHAYDELNSSAVDKKTGSNTAIFSKVVSKIRLGMSTTNNPYVFLAATDNNGDLMLARINENNFLGNNISGTNLESSLINSVETGTRSQPGGDGDQFKGLSDFRLISIPDQPQNALLFVSTNSNSSAHINPAGRNNAYLVKITTDDNTVTTAPIKLVNTKTLVNAPSITLVNGYNTIDDYKIAISPYIKDRTFGKNGYVVNENQKDMVFVNYVVGDASNKTVITQFLNAEDETINATEYGYSEGFAPPYIEKID